MKTGALRVQAEQVVLTNGVDEAIHLMCCAFLDEGDEALIAPPTFFMYDVSIGMMTRGLVKFRRMSRWSFRLSVFSKRLRRGRS